MFLRFIMGFLMTIFVFTLIRALKNLLSKTNSATAQSTGKTIKNPALQELVPCAVCQTFFNPDHVFYKSKKPVCSDECYQKSQGL